MVALATTQASGGGVATWLSDISNAISGGLHTAVTTVSGYSNELTKSLDPILNQVRVIGQEVQAAGALAKGLGLGQVGRTLSNVGGSVSGTASDVQTKMNAVNSAVSKSAASLKSPSSSTTSQTTENGKKRRKKKGQRTSYSRGSSRQTFGRAPVYKQRRR